MTCSLHFLHMTFYFVHKTLSVTVKINTLPNTFYGKKKKLFWCQYWRCETWRKSWNHQIVTYTAFIHFASRLNFCTGCIPFQECQFNKINMKFLDGVELLTRLAFDKQTFQLCLVIGGMIALSL